MEFKAEDAVEPLSYSFAPYHDSKGTVPEPTDDQVAAFYGDLGRQLELALGPERMAGVDVTDPIAVGGVFMSLTTDDHKKMYEQLLDLHAAVCSDSPGREVLEALPFRLRRAWYGAVQGWLRPEVSTPATNS